MQSNAGGQQQTFGFGQPTSSNIGLRSTQGNLFSFSPSGSNNNATSTGLAIGVSPFQNQQQFGQGGGLFGQQPQVSSFGAFGAFGAFGQATNNTTSGAAPAFGTTQVRNNLN